MSAPSLGEKHNSLIPTDHLKENPLTSPPSSLSIYTMQSSQPSSPNKCVKCFYYTIEYAGMATLGWGISSAHSLVYHSNLDYTWITQSIICSIAGIGLIRVSRKYVNNLQNK